jgi:hypothetical protein
MNRKIWLIFFLTISLSVFGQVYSNGPINGTTDAWTINNGFVVSDTFTTTGEPPVGGLAFGAWLLPGDVLESAQVTITSSPFGGSTYLNLVASFFQSGCSGNQYGFNVCTETASFGGPTLNSGTYWLSLENAVVNTGDPVYWDENSGPSRAVDIDGGGVPPTATDIGSIPSEAFTVLGATLATCGANCEPSSTTPEPGCLILLCSGGITLLGFFGRRAHKLF